MDTVKYIKTQGGVLMDSNDKKDYFEYKEGKIVYKETLLSKFKNTVTAIRKNKKLPDKEILSTTFSPSDLEKSKFFSLIKKPRVLIYPLILILAALTINIVLQSQVRGPSDVNISTTSPNISINDETLNALKDLEISEFKLTEDYLSSVTSSLYAKEMLVKILSDKENLVFDKKGLSEETLKVVNNSVEHTLEVLEALKDHNFSMVNKLHTIYFPQHS